MKFNKSRYTAKRIQKKNTKINTQIKLRTVVTPNIYIKIYILQIKHIPYIQQKKQQITNIYIIIRIEMSRIVCKTDEGIL